VGQPWRCCI